MAKDYWTSFDTPLQTQPPKGSAEGGIEYGGVAQIPEAADPLGVMPKDAKPRNIGPASKE
jgi:hypothetical protein